MPFHAVDVEEMRVTIRSLAVLTFLAIAPVSVRAQITTYVPPAPHGDSVRAAIVAEQKAQTDSATTQSLANMKTWVDSAAGVTAPDTATAQVAVAEPRPTPPLTTTFSNGAVAPETASPLPLIALVGLAALSLGTVMLAGRGRV